jgi:PAS domain S-box-containing protein
MWGRRLESTAPEPAELLSLLVESAQEYAMMTMSPTGIVTTWSVGAERLLGWRPDEAVGRSGDVIFTPEDRIAGTPEREREEAAARGRSIDERWHIRKDGSRFWGSGLLMTLPGGVGYAKVMRDQTEQVLAEEDRQKHMNQLRESEERFRTLATNVPQLVFSCLSTGLRTWGSPQWIVYTGLSLEDSVGFGWLDAVHPDDRAATKEAWTAAQACGHYYSEHRIRRAVDQDYRWHQTRAAPVPGDGDAVEWVGTSADVHAMRQLQDQQRILIAELHHRTRNMLATVQALLRQYVSGRATFEDFEARLAALSRVQGLLGDAAENEITIRQVLDAELAPYRTSQIDKLRIEGPAVTLPVRTVNVLALAIHELTTNAVKYGALKGDPGTLAVTWALRQDGSDGSRRRELELDWRESGVNISQTPLRNGYGFELLQRALPYQLKCKTRLELTPTGLHCALSIPLVRGIDVGR